MSYPCLKCKSKEATLVAVDNVPDYGHVCDDCAHTEPRSYRTHYIRLVKRIPLNKSVTGTIHASQCTCGVKFTGGVHSAWCDLG